MLEFVLERGNYWAIIGLMMIGLYISFAATNLIKRLVRPGLVPDIDHPVLYLSGADRWRYGARSCSATTMAKTKAMATITVQRQIMRVKLVITLQGAMMLSPLMPAMAWQMSIPTLCRTSLMLTAIVVGVATLAVGLAIIVRIREAYGTVEADEIRAMDLEVADFRGRE